MSAHTEGWARQRVDPSYPETVQNFAFLKKADLIVFLLIVVFGASAILLHQRTSDFLSEDAFYADAAQSLLHHGFYGVNGNPETTQPPGLACILAVLFAMSGYSYAICVVAMAVFETLGFMAIYELLRRRVPSLVAGGICILLLSSPLYFGWATRMVYPCFPYFCTTMIALLVSEEYDKAVTARSRIVCGTILTAAVAASLLIATGTIALLGAMVVVIAVTAMRDRCVARTRLLKFLPVLLVGIAVQSLWMRQKPAPLEWSLPGYPDSYLNQIKLKEGNYPELGMARWSDIPNRITTNLLAESGVLAQLVLRHGVRPTKVAVVIIPVLLIAIGWTYSVLKTGGIHLVDWYFAAYELIYLLWPWKMEPRFVLPIGPLACFYIWQGINGVVFASRRKPRIVGIMCFPAALVLSISGAQWTYTHRPFVASDMLVELMIVLWLICAGCALRMAYTGQSIVSFESSGVERWLKRGVGRLRFSPLSLVRYAGYLIVMGLTLIGILIEARIARENLSITDQSDAEKTGVSEIMAPEVEAGVWLRSHTPPESVVMARHWPTVHHYAQRKLIWFAPISDPSVLLEGIRKHGVDYIVVIKHAAPYYLPDDDYCFNQLVAGHAGKFWLVLQRANLRIFKVDKNSDAGTSASQS